MAQLTIDVKTTSVSQMTSDATQSSLRKQNSLRQLCLVSSMVSSHTSQHLAMMDYSALSLRPSTSSSTGRSGTHGMSLSSTCQSTDCLKPSTLSILTAMWAISLMKSNDTLRPATGTSMLHSLLESLESWFGTSGYSTTASSREEPLEMDSMSASALEESLHLWSIHSFELSTATSE